MDLDRENNIRRLIHNYYSVFNPDTAVELAWLLPAILVAETKFYELRQDYRGEKIIVRHKTAGLPGTMQVWEEYKYNLSKARRVRKTKYTVKEFLYKRAIYTVCSYGGGKWDYSRFYLKLTDAFKDLHKVSDEVWTKLL